MKAALSKDQELVEFIWDGSSQFVRLCYYDFAQGRDAYSDKIEQIAYAREYWKGLLQSGFCRVPTILRGKMPVSKANK